MLYLPVTLIESLFKSANIVYLFRWQCVLSTPGQKPEGPTLVARILQHMHGRVNLPVLDGRIPIMLQTVLQG